MQRWNTTADELPLCIFCFPPFPPFPAVPRTKKPLAECVNDTFNRISADILLVKSLHV